MRGPATMQSRLDEFVVKSKCKKIDRSHLAEHVSAKDRAKANPQVLHESRGKTFLFSVQYCH